MICCSGLATVLTATTSGMVQVQHINSMQQLLKISLLAVVFTASIVLSNISLRWRLNVHALPVLAFVEGLLPFCLSTDLWISNIGSSTVNFPLQDYSSIIWSSNRSDHTSIHSPVCVCGRNKGDAHSLCDHHPRGRW
jgi:hypothetical protein